MLSCEVSFYMNLYEFPNEELLASFVALAVVSVLPHGLQVISYTSYFLSCFAAPGTSPALNGIHVPSKLWSQAPRGSKAPAGYLLSI